MLFAEIDAQGWAMIIAVFFTNLGILVLAVIREVRGTSQAAEASQQAKEAAKSADEAKELLKVNTAQQAIHAEAQSEKMDQVVLHTNSMKDELVAVVKDAAFAAGAKSETDKKP